MPARARRYIDDALMMSAALMPMPMPMPMRLMPMIMPRAAYSADDAVPAR